jgi:hypothetical protein
MNDFKSISYPELEWLKLSSLFCWEQHQQRQKLLINNSLAHLLDQDVWPQAGDVENTKA